MTKPKSRPKRWAEAIDDLRAALDTLTGIKEEYEDWRDNLPENLEQSALADKLNEIADHSAFDEIESAIDDLENAELPLGFGRD